MFNFIVSLGVGILSFIIFLAMSMFIYTYFVAFWNIPPTDLPEFLQVTLFIVGVIFGVLCAINYAEKNE